MTYLSEALRLVNRLVCSLDQTGWAVVGVIVVGLGVLCMRGHGSRDTY